MLIFLVIGCRQFVSADDRFSSGKSGIRVTI